MKPTTELLPHQLEGLSMAWRHNSFALFMDMGTGKTLTALSWVFFRQFQRTLLIIRRDDFLTWKTQIEKFTTLSAQYIKGGKAKRARLLQEPGFDLYIVSYDGFKAIKKLIQLEDFDAVICDESTRLKRHKSARFKAIKRYTRKIVHRMIMTGTPSTNSVGDLFSQFLFLDDGQRLGDKYFWFKKRYYEQVGPFEWIMPQKSIDKIKKKIADICFVKSADECLKLPAQVDIIKEAEFTAEQSKYYNSIVKDWETQLPNNTTLLTEYIIAKVNKLLQISSGFIYDEAGTPLYFPSGKQQLLEDLLEDDLKPFSKVVIWYSFKAELDIICQSIQRTKAGRFVRYIDDKEKARLDFYNDPKLRFFIAPEQSGVGMNELVVAPVALYYSNSIKLEDRLQSMKRTRRKGSEIHSQVFYYDLVTAGSKDLDILGILKQNKDVLQYILQLTELQTRSFLS